MREPVAVYTRQAIGDLVGDVGGGVPDDVSQLLFAGDLPAHHGASPRSRDRQGPECAFSYAPRVACETARSRTSRRLDADLRRRLVRSHAAPARVAQAPV